jgi:hypothetical protein
MAMKCENKMRDERTEAPEIITLWSSGEQSEKERKM